MIGSTRGVARTLPPVVLLPAAIAVLFLLLPLIALVGRVSWPDLLADATSPDAVAALRLSLVTGVVATAVCVLIGFPLALLIARSPARPAAVLRALITVPLVLPPMVGGVALLFLFGRNGLLGAWWTAWTGTSIPFTTAAVVIAQVFVALPFLVLAVEGVIRARGTALEETAATLGAPPWTVLRRVTLPAAVPGLVAGTVLCFARAIGEFGATALFAGNAPGVTQTMPLAIYSAFNGGGAGQGTAVALSLVLLIAALGVLLVVRGWRPAGTT